MRSTIRRSLVLPGLLALGACGVLTTREEPLPAAWDLPAAARAYFRDHHAPGVLSWHVLGPFPSPYDPLARDLLLADGGECNVAPSSRPVTIPPNITVAWRELYSRRHDVWHPQPLLTRYAGYVPVRTGEGGMGSETALAVADLASEGGLYRLVLRAWGSARLCVDGATIVERADFHEFFGQREAFVELAPGLHRVLVKLENLTYNAQADAAQVFGSWGFTLSAARAGMLADGVYVDVPWVADALPGDTAVMGLGALRAVKEAPVARTMLELVAEGNGTAIAANPPPPGELAFLPFVVPCAEGRLPARIAVRANGARLLDVAVPRGARADALLLRAVVAPSDLSLQPYLLYLPPEKAVAPLIVYFHGGATTEEELAAWPSGLLALAAANGCAVCAPRAREGAMRSAQAESDILLSAREAAYAAGLDASAPFVAVGSGRGAAAALQLACRYPHLVRAVVAIARNPFEAEPGFGDAVQTLGPMRGNLAHTRVVLIAGAHDRAAAGAARALASLGVKAATVEPGDQPFAGGQAAAAFATCLGAPAESPRAFTFTTTRSAWRDAWWLTIDELAREDAPATIDARVTSDGRIAIDSENATRLRLAPARLPPALRTASAVVWNGREVHRGALADALALGPETPHAANVAAAPSLDELLRAGGASVAPDAPEWRAAARKLLGRGAARARMGRNAGTWSTEVLSPDDASIDPAGNALLFGGPAENPLAAALAPRVAPGLTAEAFTCDGVAFALAEHVVFLVAPDPGCPGRLVAILAGAPLARFAERYADTTLNPLAFPERAPSVMVWRVPVEGEAPVEVLKKP
jgi:hypothetical protein